MGSRALNLDLICDKCIRWKFYERDTQEIDSESVISDKINIENSSDRDLPPNLNIPDTNQLENNRVYRLRDEYHPAYDNLRITVVFLHADGDSEPPFNHQDHIRKGYSSLHRSTGRVPITRHDD